MRTSLLNDEYSKIETSVTMQLNLKSANSADLIRRPRSARRGLFDNLMMKACIATAFVFVSLLVMGVV